MLPGIVLIGVYPHYDGNIRILCGRRYNHFARTGGKMFGYTFTVSENSRAFRYDIDPKVSPWKFGRILYGSNTDCPITQFNGVVFGNRLRLQTTMNGVIG